MNDNRLITAAKLLVNAVESTNDSSSPEYIKKEQAAKIAQVSLWTISRWLKKKDEKGNHLIVWIKTGKSTNAPVRINKASFLAYLESMVKYAKKEGGDEK